MSSGGLRWGDNTGYRMLTGFLTGFGRRLTRLLVENWDCSCVVLPYSRSRPLDLSRNRIPNVPFALRVSPGFEFCLLARIFARRSVSYQRSRLSLFRFVLLP